MAQSHPPVWPAGPEGCSQARPWPRYPSWYPLGLASGYPGWTISVLPSAVSLRGSCVHSALLEELRWPFKIPPGQDWTALTATALLRRPGLSLCPGHQWLQRNVPAVGELTGWVSRPLPLVTSFGMIYYLWERGWALPRFVAEDTEAQGMTVSGV